MVASASKSSVRNIETFRPSADYGLAPWVRADWEDYIFYRDSPHDKLTNHRPYFYDNRLYIEMGAEGINHALVCDLFTMIFFVLSNQTHLAFHSVGRCLLEKPSQKLAAAPDLALYVGDEHPHRKDGERRYLNLDQWRSPDLVGEISDTTLMRDADEKKHLYQSLGIKEYWIIDTHGYRVFLFVLNEDGIYEEQQTSTIFNGLEKKLLTEALGRSQDESNMQVAQWFAQQLT